MNNVCSGYCGVACIDGTCPGANRDEYLERGIPLPDGCADCHYNRGCEDCCFEGTEYCTHEIDHEKEGNYT